MRVFLQGPTEEKAVPKELCLRYHRILKGSYYPFILENGNAVF